MAEELELRNGERVWVRPIEPEDADGLRLAFQELSEQSRYQRFFTGTPRLTDVMVEVLIHVDHVDREALVAVPTAGVEALRRQAGGDSCRPKREADGVSLASPSGSSGLHG